MSNYFGSLNFTIPYTNLSKTQNFDNSLDSGTGGVATTTGYTFVAITKSRLSEMVLYGGGYSNTVNLTDFITTTDNQTIHGTGYTIDNLKYLDSTDGVVYVLGTVPNYFADIPSGYSHSNTTQFVTEYVINKMLTRNEHFLGFIEEPTIYSDVFVERGKQGVMENNFRLGEIENTGELTIYGNKYFNIKKQ
jgi:hypothetical protein